MYKWDVGSSSVNHEQERHLMKTYCKNECFISREIMICYLIPPYQSFSEIFMVAGMEHHELDLFGEISLLPDILEYDGIPLEHIHTLLLFTIESVFKNLCLNYRIRFLPNAAIHFPKCDPTLNECPANANCEETQRGYYCACDEKFLNNKDKLTIVYPGGECLERCQNNGKTFPCACNKGFVSILNQNGRYVCTDKCRNDSDCPSGASCKKENCYCDDFCKQQHGNNCITLVKLDDVCAAPSSTTSPLLTSNMNIGDTTSYTQSSAQTLQPAPSSTTSLFLTSNVNIGDPTSYTQPSDQTLQPAPSSTTSPMPTSNVNMGDTTTYTQPRAPRPQPEDDRCQTDSITEQQIKECEKHTNNTDRLCNFLKSIVNIKEDACERNNRNTSVKEVASQITNLLNQTSLKKLDFADLQTVVIAVIENVETSLLASFSADPRNQQISTSEIEADMKVSRGHCDSGSSTIILRVPGGKMEVPCSLVSFEGGGAMFISYKGLNSRLNGSILAAFGDSDQTVAEEVISSVVGGAITSSNTENLTSPVTFSLKHLKAIKPAYSIRCVFWDTHKEVWSTRGCETQLSEQVESTLCVCTHLSTFAVIMAPTKIQVDAGLRILSIIGLSISLVCLCFTFLTFILCRSLRSAHTSVLAALCGCLFLGQLLVLVGLQQTWNTILCSVIAGSLQFLFLCAFCWMSLESILLFMTVRNLQAVNYMNSQRSHFPYVCLIGFGIPAIIVIISASVFPDIYEKTYCWLKISHIWSFLGPVCTFISVNFVFLVLTFWLLRKKLASLNANVSTLKNTRLLTFKAFSQLFILGCTWIIGLFQFGSGSLVASYIFTICNSLQGLYIFLVHCVLNRQVREEYRRGFRRLYSKKSMTDTVSGSTVRMTIKPSHVSEVSKEDVQCCLENTKS
ncbi:adhesion G protein-coupled receptor E3-like [Rhinoderma darwinii]|uniref:adhesion G protein-coupled receptor E3-like n=1 Tax=Rhinoderma darwinii TaxID=43563 RepID=UPI003F681D3F